MASVVEFFEMGGYAFYVWSSYGLTSIFLAGVVFWSAQQFRKTREQAFRRARQYQGRRRK